MIHVIHGLLNKYCVNCNVVKKLQVLISQAIINVVSEGKRKCLETVKHRTKNEKQSMI